MSTNSVMSSDITPKNYIDVDIYPKGDVGDIFVPSIVDENLLVWTRMNGNSVVNVPDPLRILSVMGINFVSSLPSVAEGEGDKLYALALDSGIATENQKYILYYFVPANKDPNNTAHYERIDSGFFGSVAADITAANVTYWNNKTEKTYVDNADHNLQQQIDAITVGTDVVDIVGTYTDLQNYDTTKLTNDDIIKVLQDSTHNNALSYYRWVITSNVGAWSYVGSEGPFYTKGETDTLLNGKVGFTDYATDNSVGIIRGNNAFATGVDNAGNLYAKTKTYSDYTNGANSLFIGKATLENVITGKELTNKTYVDNANAIQDEKINDLIDHELIKDASGVNIYLDNVGKDAKIYDFKLDKLSTQETTTGKNLLDISSMNATSGVTQSLNGDTLTINATNSWARVQKTLTLTANKNYTLMGYVTGTSGYNAGLLVTNSNESYQVKTLKSNGVRTYLCLNFNTNTATELIIQLYSNWSGTSANTITVFEKIMLLEGTYESEEEYEEYTGGIPSPNPDYPQEVNTVKGYRNLFDINNITLNHFLEVNGGIGTSSVSNISDYIPVKANQIYYLSYSYNSLANNNNRVLCYYNTSKTYLSGMEVSPSTFHTFTPTQDGYIRFSYDINYINIQLNEGDIPLPYVPYGTNWIYTKITGKNLCSNKANNVVIATIPAGTYTFSLFSNISGGYTLKNGGGSGATISGTNYISVNTKSSATFTINEETSIFINGYSNTSGKTFGDDTIQWQLESNPIATTYEAYKENLVLIPLNNNEICGIGDYKDELVIDELGNAKLVKKIYSGQLTSTTSSNWYVSGHAVKTLIQNTDLPMPNYDYKGTSIDLFAYCSHFTQAIPSSMYQGTAVLGFGVEGDNGNQNNNAIYFANNDITANNFKTFLDNNTVKIYYVLKTPQEIDLNYTVDLTLYEGTNNISNSENANMSIKYVQNIYQLFSDYVKFSDYATSDKTGVVKVSNQYGIDLNNDKKLYGIQKTYSDYTNFSNFGVISKGTLENVITGKGLVSKTNYPTGSSAGVMKLGNGLDVTVSGVASCDELTAVQYNNAATSYFISKGTLDNVLTATVGDINSTLDSINGESI